MPRPFTPMLPTDERERKTAAVVPGLTEQSAADCRDCRLAWMRCIAPVASGALRAGSEASAWVKKKNSKFSFPP
jgi:hypothetical protein